MTITLPQAVKLVDHLWMGKIISDPFVTNGRVGDLTELT